MNAVSWEDLHVFSLQLISCFISGVIDQPLLLKVSGGLMLTQI